MPKHRPFHQLDVFSKIPLLGNALAVVHQAEGMTDEEMSAFARWTNLSETTFLTPPTQLEADYRVRIFTPEDELPFAGHPTLGSCYAWLAAGGKPRTPGVIVQECGVGLVTIRQQDGRLAFAAPPLRRTGDLDEATLAQITRGLGLERKDLLDHQWVDNGPGWCVVMLKSAEQVLAIRPDFGKLKGLSLGVIGQQAPGSNTDFEVRAFVPSLGVPEDPVTGSLNAGIAQWLIGSGKSPTRYVVSQGTAIHRSGRVYVEQSGSDIWIGGDVVICIEGSVML